MNVSGFTPKMLRTGNNFHRLLSRYRPYKQPMMAEIFVLAEKIKREKPAAR